MTDSLLSTSDPAKVEVMKAAFHADRALNQPRRVAIARTMRLLCAPVDWWRIYGETFSEAIRPTGKRI